MNRILRALRAIVVELVAPLEASVKVRYRVVAMSVDRVQLQAVKQGKWPNIVPCPIRMGTPGVRARLTPGSIVVVEFLENDWGLPVVTHFGTPGEPGFVPAALVLGADSDTAPAAARVGDTVSIFFPPAMPVTGTVSGQPFVGTITVPGPGIGTIQTGSTKVGIGS